MRSALLLLGLLARCVTGYQVLVTDQDEVRQVCSGMWGKGAQDPFIEVLFSPSSRGQAALVVYEWQDAKYLGVGADGQQGDNDWSEDRVYICTVDAQQKGLCTTDQLGQFVTSASTPAESSIYTSPVRFDSSSASDAPTTNSGRGPYRYEVSKTGYYCVGIVPVALEGAKNNSTFMSVVDFENVFKGHLPASEYPKVAFYRILFLVYLGFGAFWAVLSWTYRRDLLPLQKYITATVAFLVVEQIFVWLYYRFLNNWGHPGVAGAYLFTIAALNAARNSVSLYLLCLASMGLSIVRPSLGGVLARVRLLALFHFIFGLFYSVGTVTIPLEAAGFFVLFFVVPLSISLTCFLLWIMYSLNSTISDLGARRQTYKRKMFRRLYAILLGACISIALFYIASSITFSTRLDPGFPAKTWKWRWLLIDGWLSILYAVVFFAIAFLWRPSGTNRRLALSDELPMSENEADMYDVDSMLPEEDREDAGELKGETYPLTRVSGDGRREHVVFDVGSDGEGEEDDEETPLGHGRNGKSSFERRARRRSSSTDGRSDGEDGFDITRQHQAKKEEEEEPPEYKPYKDD